MSKNNHYGMPFRLAVSPQAIQQALDTYEVKYRSRIFDPQTTIWAWMAQIASADKSCRHAVSQVVAQYATDGKTISPSTGAYVEARSKLDIRVVKKLARSLARELENECASYQLIDRPLFAVDGTGISCPDTPSIIEHYPSQDAHRVCESLGFPLIKVVLITSLATGAIIDIEYGPHKGKNTHEIVLFYKALERLQRGDVVVGDRAYSASLFFYWMPFRGIDLIARKHTQIRLDRYGIVEALGQRDWIRNVKKPRPQPAWLTALKYRRTPTKYPVRSTAIQVQGCSGSKWLELLSSFKDASIPKPTLAEIYQRRWDIETDIRSFKIDLGADILRCKSVEMVEKELWMTVLTYNAVRCIMANAAKKTGRAPRTVSFKGALQAINTFSPRFVHTPVGREDEILSRLLDVIASHEVADRPGRVEPRAVKRRRKPITELKTTRDEARRQCRVGDSR